MKTDFLPVNIMLYILWEETHIILLDMDCDRSSLWYAYLMYDRIYIYMKKTFF